MNQADRKLSVFITGATGFVGTALTSKLVADNFDVTAAVLPGESADHLHPAVKRAAVGPLSDSSDYASVLTDVDIVVHLAARVHVMHETASDPLQEFRVVNLHGTKRLARQAVAAGAKRFVFMSTIGVNGDNSGDKAYTDTDIPHPHNHYSMSKYEAELALQQISEQSGIEIVIIRAPLVYGPGNPGNFFSFLRVLAAGTPLPLASVSNRRSFIYLGNLADVLSVCTTHSAAAGKTFLVSDGEDVSTPELVRLTATALGVPARLFPLPPMLMRWAGRLIGKSSAVNRLTGSLAVDSSRIKKELGWSPPYKMREGLRATAEWFTNRRGTAS